MRAGTILHASHLPLWKWLLAVHLMASADDITAYRLARSLGISYKTAAHLSHTIRAAMEPSVGTRPTLVELLSRLIDADAGQDARLFASA